MPFVVPGVCRYTINGTINDRTSANILDMQIDTTGTVVTRTEAVLEVAKDILNAWHGNVLAGLSAGAVATSVTWVDLDEADGSTGEITSTSSNNWPSGGPAGGETLPGATSVLVRKLTTSGRGQRSGRLYLAGMNEGAIQGQFLTAGAFAGLQTQFDNFANAINDQGIFDIQRQLVVVHVLTREAPTPESAPGRGDGHLGAPLTGNYTAVENLAVEQRLATQRRRLRG